MHIINPGNDSVISIQGLISTFGLSNIRDSISDFVTFTEKCDYGSMDQLQSG